MTRSITEHEADVVRWMLRNACRTGNLQHLVATVAQLRVVPGCDCASIDFRESEESDHPLADASAPGGGLILWGTEDSIGSLEMFCFDEPRSHLPGIETLQPSLP